MMGSLASHWRRVRIGDGLLVPGLAVAAWFLAPTFLACWLLYACAIGIASRRVYRHARRRTVGPRSILDALVLVLLLAAAFLPIWHLHHGLRDPEPHAHTILEIGHVP